MMNGGKTMLQLGLLVAAMFVLQTILSCIQMRHFSKAFIALRRRGKVACGRRAGGFHAGAIVMFLLDADGTIREGQMLMGVTCFARVKSLKGFEGKYIGSLDENDLPKYGRNLRRAILDARDTYNRFMSGETIAEPPSPFQRVGRGLAGFRKTAG